uniref:Charged multivesicular body protein 7 isoform X1 n=1 Tax=Tanacetum cinerariifolium TaxID=118510 RepID=A0A6L2KSR8_TANCI|nr:charged multivesicular body protein 7 isoform X1 [Tanacetum cinerariifolium]
MEHVKEFILEQVPDWDSDVMINARFKAFSGQKSDWEPRFHFWKDLIIKIARHLNTFIIRPSVVKNAWFNQGGLIPLCIDHVLLEMYNAGDILSINDLGDPKSGQLSQLFQKVRYLLPLSKSVFPSEDEFIVKTLLEEKSVEVVKLLSDDHWTSSCIITMSKFQAICGGSKEASMILSHLSKCGKAKYLAVRRNDLIEGVKVCLSSKAVSGTTSSDYDVLHLTWTAEKLQLQMDMIDQRHDKSKLSALACLKSGNKAKALRHARELKLSSESREKCDVLLRRVEEVLRAIADAEDSKEVFEAIKSGTKAMKDKMITIEEVQHCLDELDETIDSQKQVDKIIGSISSYDEFDEDLEDELDKLMEESEKSSVDITIRKDETESLNNALSGLKIADNVVIQEKTETSNVSKGEWK